MISSARLRCPLEYCTATTVGDMVKVTLAVAETCASSSRSVTSCVIRAMIADIRDCTISAVGPLAWTMSADSLKLEDHWPP